MPNITIYLNDREYEIFKTLNNEQQGMLKVMFKATLKEDVKNLKQIYKVKK